MPHQLEGFKLAEASGSDNKKVLIGIVLAAFLAAPVSFWAYLHMAYKIGRDGGPIEYAPMVFNRLQGWLYSPTQPDYAATTAMVVGLVFTVFLSAMRMRFTLWSFHPAGFAVSSSWLMSVFWSSIFISWVIKLAMLKLGGLKLHRRSIPFFLGLILGEFVVRGAWAIFGFRY
jgi:hypothetical protein